MAAPTTDGPPQEVKPTHNLGTNLLYYLVPLVVVSGLCIGGYFLVKSVNDTPVSESPTPEVAATTPPVDPPDPPTPQVELFPTDRVMDVQITVDDKDWNKIRFQTRNIFEVLQTKRKYEQIPSPYVYVPAKVTIDGVEYPEVGLRKKGFIGSQNSTRPSLKVKLNYVNKSAQVGGLTNLTFNTNNPDITLMSQVMGYAFFNANGTPAPRCSYARISVNGKPVGLYTHVETVRKTVLERGFGNTTGTLYEGTVVDFFDDWQNSFELKIGTPESDQKSREKMKRLIEVLKRPTPAATETPETKKQGEELQAAIGELVDLDSFYTYWAIESLLGFWDGYTANANNFFIYDNPTTNKFHFMPWGGDCMFEKKSKLRVDPRAPLSVKTKGLIAHKLYQIPAARERYASTLKQIMETHWKEDTLLAETQRIESLVKTLIPPEQASKVRFDGIRQFIRNRRGDIERETADGMPVWAAKPQPPPLLAMPGAGGRKQDTNTIFYAAKTGKIDQIKQFLAKKVDINGFDEGGTTALSHAVLAGKTEAVGFLIAQGADATLSNRDGNTVLHGAAFLGRHQIARMLLDGGAKPNARNNKGETPLDSCSPPWSDQIQGFVQFIAGLLQISVDMDQVRSGRPQVVAILREHGGLSGAEVADRKKMDLWQAARAGKLSTLKKRLDKIKDVNALDGKGISPLSWAVMAGKSKAAKLLIERGANVNQKNRDGSTPLHAAAFLGQLELVTLLLEHKADINSRNGQDETPLGTVAPAWNSGVRQVTQIYARLLELKIDIEAIKIARPKIAALLTKSGGKLGSELTK
ncbi:MAG: CotH kinase family protein [Planctomycetota bacterium]|nr:CotH kinase family protein [Planctomycetota bacterium]